MTAKTIAIYGGSFDPPHAAHVAGTSWVLETNAVDAVWWIPVYRHAFEHKRAANSFEHRVAMCRLAIEPFGDRAVVSEVERGLGDESRTVDTLEHLRDCHPNLSFRLVVGADIFSESHLWKAFDRVVELAPLLVLGRPGFDVPEPHIASPPMPGVSSSEIRRRVAQDEPCESLVAANVLRYITSHDLYKAVEQA